VLSERVPSYHRDPTGRRFDWQNERQFSKTDAPSRPEVGLVSKNDLRRIVAPNRQSPWPILRNNKTMVVFERRLFKPPPRFTQRMLWFFSGNDRMRCPVAAELR
jgi:hypothetical protein